MTTKRNRSIKLTQVDKKVMNYEIMPVEKSEKIRGKPYIRVQQNIQRTIQGDKELLNDNTISNVFSSANEFIGASTETNSGLISKNSLPLAIDNLLPTPVMAEYKFMENHSEEQQTTLKMIYNTWMNGSLLFRFLICIVPVFVCFGIVLLNSYYLKGDTLVHKMHLILKSEEYPQLNSREVREGSSKRFNDYNQVQSYEIANFVNKLLSDAEKRMEKKFSESNERMFRSFRRKFWMRSLNTNVEKKNSNSCEFNEEYLIEVMRKMIEKYDADKTGLHDFALESAGGTIFGELCSKTYERSWHFIKFFGIPLFFESYGPRVVIQHKAGLSTGECWCFEGSLGDFAVKLSQQAFVNAISYEHIHKNLTADGSSCSSPKLFQIWGYMDANNVTNGQLIGEFDYNDLGPPLQIFHIRMDDGKEASPPVSIIHLRVLSNHGCNYTCLYRFRVHGKPAINV